MLVTRISTRIYSARRPVSIEVSFSRRSEIWSITGYVAFSIEVLDIPSRKIPITSSLMFEMSIVFPGFPFLPEEIARASIPFASSEVYVGCIFYTTSLGFILSSFL